MSRHLAIAAIAAGGLTLLAAGTSQAQELRGHGGPVRSIAVTADGRTAMTGSFDQSVIRWQLDTGTATAVLRFHEGAVNAVLALPDGSFATAGGDGRIALWPVQPATGAPPRLVLEGHTAPIAALAVAADGTQLASASWDGTARIWSLTNDASATSNRVLEGHRGQVNGIAFTQGSVVTAGYDATLRFWPETGDVPRIATLPAALNQVLAARDGEIVVSGADGRLRLFGPDLTPRAEIEIGSTPIIALALSEDGATIAAGGLRGDVALVDRASRSRRAVLVGPGLPVWSLAFAPDGRTLYSGGADRIVRRWDAITGEHIGAVSPRAGEDVLAAFRGERGAELFRACAACHTLTPDDGARAGPSLHGLFGRRIGSLPGYRFSAALTAMDIVWTPDTVAKLFEIGPTAYTPGTKMPEQTVPDPQDRAALIRFLERATR